VGSRSRAHCALDPAILDPPSTFFSSADAAYHNYNDLRGIHTYARRGDATDASARDCNRVEIGQARRGEAVPPGIASHVVQYVHSGSIDT